MKNPSKETQSQRKSGNCITVEVSRGSHKDRYNLQLKDVVFRFLGSDSGQISVRNVGNECGLILRRKVPYKAKFTFDFVRIPSLMIYTDLIEYKIVAQTKAPELRQLSFFNKLKAGDDITTVQFKIYPTFSNLQIRTLLNISFRRTHDDLVDPIGEKTCFFLLLPFVLL